MLSQSAQLLALHVGWVQTHGPDTFSARTWTTGFFKNSVEGALGLRTPSPDGTRAGLEGDAQADLIFHGGPDKAVCVYASEHYPFWRRELRFESLPFGAFGENFTLQGLLETEVCIGDAFGVGGGPDAPVLQISQPRQPCWKLARRWNVKDLALRVQQNGRTGWYFRVLSEGIVAPSAILTLQARPHPEWPLSLANEIMHLRKTDWDAAAQLAACPLLSQSWKNTLGQRAESGRRPIGRRVCKSNLQD